MPRVISIAVLLISLCLFAVAPGQEKKGAITETQFRRISTMLLEDPLGESAKDYAKAVMVFAIETPQAAVFLGKDELKWMGEDKDRSLLLMAAYLAGNTQSQLNSGVKRNDRYSGVLYLFRVYRTLQKRDKDFKIAEVDNLLKLQREDKLLRHLQELEEKSPTKLSPDDEAGIKKRRQKD